MRYHPIILSLVLMISSCGDFKNESSKSSDRKRNPQTFTVAQMQEMVKPTCDALKQKGETEEMTGRPFNFKVHRSDCNDKITNNDNINASVKRSGTVLVFHNVLKAPELTEAYTGPFDTKIVTDNYTKFYKLCLMASGWDVPPDTIPIDGTKERQFTFSVNKEAIQVKICDYENHKSLPYEKEEFLVITGGKIGSKSVPIGFVLKREIQKTCEGSANLEVLTTTSNDY